MLTLTDKASTAVKAIISQHPEVTDGGLRINTRNGNASQFDVAIVPAPEAADIVVSNAGAQVYLEELAAKVLDDKVLDVTVDDDGSVSFAIAGAA